MASFNDKQYTVEKLAEITSSGFDVALFPQIRDAITRKMMEIYGNDIDVSSASADGQYIQAIANIVNNIYRMLERTIAQLNPSSATGNFLDILASYNNIFRTTATYSKAKVWVCNLSNSVKNDIREIRAMDKNGTIWVWYNPLTIDGSFRYVFDDYNTMKTAPIELEFTCETVGKVIAEGDSSTNDISNIDWTKGVFDSYAHGDIYTTVSGDDFYLCQIKDAAIGENTESDSSLRNRRLQQYGNTSITVMEALKSNLLELGAVQDVFLINNNTGNPITSYSNVTIANHDIFIVVRKKENTELPSIDVAKIIYRTLTPGVLTKFSFTQGANIYGVNQEYSIELMHGVTTTYSWKLATPIHPVIEINGKLINNNSGTSLNTTTSTQYILIKNAILNYLNNIKINEAINFGELVYIIQNQDLRPLGTSSFFIEKADFSDTLDPLDVRTYLTYFDYSNIAIAFEDDSFTITVSGE